MARYLPVIILLHIIGVFSNDVMKIRIKSRSIRLYRRGKVSLDQLSLSLSHKRVYMLWSIIHQLRREVGSIVGTVSRSPSFISWCVNQLPP